MKNRDEILTILRSEKARLQATYPVQSLALFGSVVRGEANENSDVDVLIELGPGVGLFGFCDIEEQLGKALGAKVDLVPRGGLKKRIRDRVLSEAVTV